MKKTAQQKQKFNFIEWNNNILLNSFKKINLNIIIIVILDALFYLSSGYLAVFWLQRVQAKMASFNVPADIMSLGLARAQQFVSEVKTFYYLIIFSLVLLLVAIIFLASVLKGVIWAKTTKTRMSLKLLSKFFVLNLVWMGFWYVLLFLIAYLAERTAVPILFIASIILAFYFTNTLYTIFMKEQTLKSIFKAIKLNVAKLHLFLLPYAVIALLLYIILKLANLIKFKYSTILLGLILLIYVAIVRYYVSALVIEIEKS